MAFLLLAAVHVLLLVIPALILGPRALLVPAVLVFLAGAVGLQAVEARLPWRGEQPDRATRWLALLGGVGLLLAAWAGLCERALGHGFSGSFQVLGAALLSGGLVLRGAAVRALGARFRTAVVVGPRIRSGVYSCLHHPSEAGLLLYVLGGALLLGSSGSLAVGLLVVLPGALLRMRAEERAFAWVGPAG